MAEGGLSKGAKIALWIVGGLGLLVAIIAGAGYYWWSTKGAAWGAELREMGKQVVAEGAAAGANASKDQCVQLAMKRLSQTPGFVDQVRIELFLESCLNAAQGNLAYCADAPENGEIMATVAWRLKTSQALGLAQSENPIVKGIQKHCSPR